MSKIDEMALKAYPVKHKQNKVGAEYDANYPRRAAFVNGAKAVLEEIENILIDKKYVSWYGETPFVESGKMMEDLKNRINELKG